MVENDGAPDGGQTQTAQPADAGSQTGGADARPKAPASSGDVVSREELNKVIQERDAAKDRARQAEALQAQLADANTSVEAFGSMRKGLAELLGIPEGEPEAMLAGVKEKLASVLLDARLTVAAADAGAHDAADVIHAARLSGLLKEAGVDLASGTVQADLKAVVAKVREAKPHLFKPVDAPPSEPGTKPDSSRPSPPTRESLERERKGSPQDRARQASAEHLARLGG